jgi:hypothetical protein
VDTYFETGKYITKQLGAVHVIVDNQNLIRNVSNATAAPGADGNYEEVPSLTYLGLSNTIRLNEPLGVDVPYIVRSTEGMCERPTGSMMALIDALAVRTTAVEVVNTTQDSRLTTLETPIPEYDAGTANGAKTITFTPSRTIQKVTVAGNSSFTLAGGVAGQFYFIRFVQSGAGNFTYTWTTPVKWPLAVAPVGSPTGKEDMIGLYYTGSAWNGNFSENI